MCHSAQPTSAHVATFHVPELFTYLKPENGQHVRHWTVVAILCGSWEVSPWPKSMVFLLVSLQLPTKRSPPF